MTRHAQRNRQMRNTRKDRARFLRARFDLWKAPARKRYLEGLKKKEPTDAQRDQP